MRIPVDIPKRDLELMKEAAGELNISRAEFIRQAIAASLTPYSRKMNHSAFGSWSNYAQDGLTYQKRIREEW